MDESNNDIIFVCAECGLHYQDQATAEACETWCRGQKSCNPQITALSIERRQAQQT